MYERFTDRARQVMQLANQEAKLFNHEYIGTEHILLGLGTWNAGGNTYEKERIGCIYSSPRTRRAQVEKDHEIPEIRVGAQAGACERCSPSAPEGRAQPGVPRRGT